jgi:hypothetical protein
MRLCLRACVGVARAAQMDDRQLLFVLQRREFQVMAFQNAGDAAPPGARLPCVFRVAQSVDDLRRHPRDGELRR